MKIKVYKHSLFPYTKGKMEEVRLEYYNHVREGQERALWSMARGLRKYNKFEMPCVRERMWHRAFERQFKSELLKAQLRIISKVLGTDK